MPNRKINSGRQSGVNRPNAGGVPINPAVPAPYDRTIFDLVADGRYNAFANDPVTMDNEKKIYFFRSGSDHLTGGRIDALDYNRISKTWSNRRTVYTPTAGLDCRDPRSGRIGNTIFIFFSRRNETSGLTDSQGYIYSSNGGLTWSTFNSLPKVYDYCLPWGDLITLDTAGHYMIPYYESNFGAGQIYAVKAHKTTDSGATWTQQTIYSGTTYHINESWAVNCGSGRIVMLCRRSTYWGQTGNLMQITSSDGGATWSAPAASNLGSTNENIPCLYYDNITDRITVIFQDRSDGYIKVSTGNDPAIVIASPTSWNAAQNYEYNNDPPDNGHNGVGYPSYNGEVCIWAKEVSATVCDLKWRQENMSTY